MKNRMNEKMAMQMKELDEVASKHPFYIPIDEAAKFLHMKPDCLTIMPSKYGTRNFKFHS